MLDYTVETKLSVKEAAEKLQVGLKEKSFGVLHVYDLKEIFQSKGIEFGEYQILSVCNPKFAKEALDTNLKVGALLPCKISVYAKDRVTKVSLLRPKVAIGLLGDKKLDTLAGTAEDILKSVVDSI
ncbi:MAG: DUF302 domain-containing protein [Candidatus Omnitrophica bacterium]|nr:DUF302 domain-containing protein [Candidatus Omnitrophota bacterium]